MSCSAIQISQTLSQIWAQTVSVVTDSFPNPTGKAPSLILRGQSTGDTRPDSVTPGDSGSSDFAGTCIPVKSDVPLASFPEEKWGQSRF